MLFEGGGFGGGGFGSGFGEAILGANAFRDMFAGIRDIVGGRSGAYERELERARSLALDDLRNVATQVGADAVIVSPGVPLSKPEVQRAVDASPWSPVAQSL